MTEENGKLVGHQNHRQKIEYLVKLKKENTKMQEVGWVLSTGHLLSFSCSKYNDNQALSALAMSQKCRPLMKDM